MTRNGEEINHKLKKMLFRRTFMPTIRSFVRPKHFIKPIKNDTNNNDLATLSTSLNPVNKQSNNSMINSKLSTVLEKDSISIDKAHYKNPELKEQLMKQLNGIHTTSTPHLNHKFHTNFTDQMLSEMKFSGELQEPNLIRTSTSIHTKQAESISQKVYKIFTSFLI